MAKTIDFCGFCDFRPILHHSIIPSFHHSIIPSFHHSNIPIFQYSNIPSFQSAQTQKGTEGHAHPCLLNALNTRF